MDTGVRCNRVQVIVKVWTYEKLKLSVMGMGTRSIDVTAIALCSSFVNHLGFGTKTSAPREILHFINSENFRKCFSLLVKIGSHLTCLFCLGTKNIQTILWSSDFIFLS